MCQSDTILRSTLSISLGPAGKWKMSVKDPGVGNVDSYASCLPSQKATEAESRSISCVISMLALNPESHLFQVLFKQAQSLLSAGST